MSGDVVEIFTYGRDMTDGNILSKTLYLCFVHLLCLQTDA